MREHNRPNKYAEMDNPVATGQRISRSKHKIKKPPTKVSTRWWPNRSRVSVKRRVKRVRRRRTPAVKGRPGLVFRRGVAARQSQRRRLRVVVLRVCFVEADRPTVARLLFRQVDPAVVPHVAVVAAITRFHGDERGFGGVARGLLEKGRAG